MPTPKGVDGTKVELKDLTSIKEELKGPSIAACGAIIPRNGANGTKIIKKGMTVK